MPFKPDNEVVAKGYRAWWSMVGNEKAGPIQIKESKTAFYCGWYDCLTSLMGEAIADLSDDDGAVQLQASFDECKAYFLKNLQGQKH